MPTGGYGVVLQGLSLSMAPKDSNESPASVRLTPEESLEPEIFLNSNIMASSETSKINIVLSGLG